MDYSPKNNDSEREGITLDQFFIECAVRLEKTQIEFEGEYYIMDLFDVLEAKRKVDAEELLADLTNINSQHMDKENFKKYTTELQKQAGIAISSKHKFDGEGFERLQMRLKAGL